MSELKWYEKYLPFVAKSMEMQVSWLDGALRKSLDKPDSGHTFSLDEITPYVRLLLEVDEDERSQNLPLFLAGLDERIIGQMLRVADIYDTIILFELLPQPTEEYAVIALSKEPPPFEKKPYLITDKLFLALHRKAPAIMEAAVEVLQGRNMSPPHFDQAHARFKDMLMDEELLSSLFPKAKA